VRPPFLAHDVGFDPGGARVWVTSGDRGRIAIYGGHSRRLLRILHADAAPQHVTFVRNRAFVASGDDGTVRVYEERDAALVCTTRVPLSSYNVQEGWGSILTPSLSAGTLTILWPTGVVRLSRRVARSSHDACFVMVA
jgi:hypothetical protein